MLERNGSIKGRKKVTGKLLFQPTGENGYIDFGNVLMHKRAPAVEKHKYKTAKKGMVVTSDEEPSSVEIRWQVKGDEHTPEAIELLSFSERGEDVEQAVAAGINATIENVKQGRSYYIGARNLDNVQVAQGGNPLIEGTDYTVDAKSGMLTVLKDGGIDDGTDIDLTFDRGAVKFATFKGPKPSRISRKGQVRFIEFDGHSEVERAVHQFAGTISASDWGENTGAAGNEFTYDLLARGEITTEERVDEYHEDDAT